VERKTGSAFDSCAFPTAAFHQWRSLYENRRTVAGIAYFSYSSLISGTWPTPLPESISRHPRQPRSLPLGIEP